MKPLPSANDDDRDTEARLRQSPIPRGRRRLAIRPRYMTINDWVQYSGIGRTLTYELIAEAKLKTIVVGKRRLVDVDAGVAYLETLGN